MTAFGDMIDVALGGGVVASQAPRRGRSRVSRMIGRWPDGIQFEDAIVPREGFLRSCPPDAQGIWPESSLSLEVGIVRGR